MIDIEHEGPALRSPLAVECMVRMRDGIRLATDVYIPGKESFETAQIRDVVLIRLPYDKSGDYCFIPLVAEYFMEHGYIVIAQDVRGKFRSEGETLLFVNEQNDGYDTIEWIINQPWSNGKVAMWGLSYFGYTQWAAVASGHPALKAISPRVTGTQLGEPEFVIPGHKTRRVEWAVSLQYPLTFFHSNDNYYWDFDYDKRPFSDQVEQALEQIGSRSISYDQWYPHAVHLRRFDNVGSPFSRNAIPTLHTIGWWDNCAWLSWDDVYRIQQNPSWDLNHFLRIESVDHEDYYLDEPEELRVEERTTEQLRGKLSRLLDPTIEFFEVFVRGNGSWTDIPRVNWNLAGTDHMRHSETWPPPGIQEHRLFAHANGSLGKQPPSKETCTEWIHDPFDLVPSSAPNAFSFLLTSPDETLISDRDDVLVFSTDKYDVDLNLVGRVNVSLVVGSTGPVMDVFVHLCDLSPDGSTFRIARGNIQVDDPGDGTPVNVDLSQVGYRLKKGHRLQLTVASSNFPEFLPQPGTGENPWSARERVRNTQSLHLGGPQTLTLTFSELPEGASC